MTGLLRAIAEALGLARVSVEERARRLARADTIARAEASAAAVERMQQKEDRFNEAIQNPLNNPGRVGPDGLRDADRCPPLPSPSVGRTPP